jgi:hypothetical protein
MSREQNAGQNDNKKWLRTPLNVWNNSNIWEQLLKIKIINE